MGESLGGLLAEARQKEKTMAYIKADNEQEQMYFDFLEDLRKSGDTNMFGASPYLQRAYGLGRKEAQEVLGKWMRLHDDSSRCSDKPFTKTKTKVRIKTTAEVTSERRP
jgi:hypothetical protein